MKKKQIDDLSTPSSIEEGVMIERIAIFYKNHTVVIPISIHHNVPYYYSYVAGSICRDEKTIDELIKNNAPIEVFYKDVNCIH